MATTTLPEAAAKHSAVAEVLLPVQLPTAMPPKAPRPEGPAAPHKIPIRDTFLTDTLLENHHLENSKKSKALDLLIVILMHVALITGPILAGLYFTDTLNLKQLYATMIVAPPPPPPPPPPPAAAARALPPKRVLMQGGKLAAPTRIPQRVAEIKEAPLESDAFGVEGGVPGGVPGGQMGGVIGGILSGSKTTVAPPPPPVARAPIRVGGKVRPPRAIYTPAPPYPIIARQTKIQGVVVIDAILDEKGNVVEAKVVSGHPLLIQAALDTVRDWKYEPTYLNNEPISIELIVNVTFTLQ